mgnify:CR=1 FL=1
MRFLFKTSYDQDLRLFKHGGQVFWYAVLGVVLLAAPWWAKTRNRHPRTNRHTTGLLHRRIVEPQHR